jgi:outer membrane immunogenic protein
MSTRTALSERLRTGFGRCRGNRHDGSGSPNLVEHRTGDFAMKKLFLATTAFVVLAAASAGAADMSARPMYAPPPPVPVYTWTGIYWGANVGYSWGQSKNDRSVINLGVTASESQNIDGVIGGVQTGYNYQFGAWVLGLETDIQASGQKGGSTLQLLAAPSATLTTDHKLSWFGTTRPRLGFLATPNLLLYGTAGVAYGQVKDNYTAAVAGIGTVATASVDDVRAGWTAGAGIEGAFGGGWSAKVEYLYVDLGKLQQTVTLPPAGITATFNSRLTDNIVRVGLNYKFGGGY